MSAAVLREAAALMRERAEAARPFELTEGWWKADVLFDAFAAYADDDEAAIPGAREDAEHIAGMHPTVALAVADWLEHYAIPLERELPVAFAEDAIAVARAYLATP